MSKNRDPNVTMLLTTIRGARTLAELDVLEDLASPWWPSVRETWERRREQIDTETSMKSRRST